MFDNITIVFSGYNIKWFAVLAIESFLLYYPKLRKNIIYFDDNSTDGTREELENRGIRVISWKNYSLQNECFEKSEDCKDIINKLSVRVAFIMKEIMTQCDTKYLLINDGDVVYKNGKFLEEYAKFLEEGYKIITHLEYIACSLTQTDIKNFSDLQKYYYNRHIEGPENYIGTPRVHLIHTLIDLDYFKQINLLGDRDDIEVLRLINGKLIDTGSDFYYQIEDRGIPAKYLTDEFVYNTIKHWSWISSSNKDTNKDTINSSRNQIEELRKALYSEGIAEICRKINLHPMKLLVFYEKTKNKG